MWCSRSEHGGSGSGAQKGTASRANPALVALAGYGPGRVPLRDARGAHLFRRSAARLPLRAPARFTAAQKTSRGISRAESETQRDQLRHTEPGHARAELLSASPDTRAKRPAGLVESREQEDTANDDEYEGAACRHRTTRLTTRRMTSPVPVSSCLSPAPLSSQRTLSL